MSKKIIFSAGGTGGHIIPAINLMNHFFEKGYEVVLITDKRGSNFINKREKFRFHELKAETLTNKNIISKFISLIIIFYSFIKSIIILKKEKPDLIIGFGGYASFPPSFVSRFINLPLIIYEPNMTMGRANKYLLSLSKKVFLAKKITLPLKYKNKIYITGTIINKKIINHSNFENNINKNNLSILILGGSQSAKIFGEIIPPVMNMLKNKGYNIKVNQQCSKNQKDTIIEYYKKNKIKNYVFTFEKNISDLILSSDLAVTRCGASTTAELAYANIPFVAVPIPNSIDNHQYLNAQFYEDEGCCKIIEQSKLSEKSLFNLIIEMKQNEKKINGDQKNIKKINITDVYSIIEKEIKETI